MEVKIRERSELFKTLDPRLAWLFKGGGGVNIYGQQRSVEMDDVNIQLHPRGWHEPFPHAKSAAYHKCHMAMIKICFKNTGAAG